MRWYSFFLCLLLIGSLLYAFAPMVRGDDANLTTIPDAWGQYSKFNRLVFSLPDPQIIFYDPSVYHTPGAGSIRIDPNIYNTNPMRECDADWIAVKPGDHIVFSSWMKVQTGPSTTNYPNCGARIGVDFYNDHYLDAVIYAGQYEFPIDYSTNQVTRNWVQDANGGAWQQRTLDFIVPASVHDSTTGGSNTPTGIIAWMQGGPWTSESTASPIWFADASLTINPTPTPSPTPTATPTPTPEPTPSPTPTPTVTPTPTPSPAPTASFTPSPTPSPIPTPIQTPLSSPAATPFAISNPTSPLHSSSPLSALVSGGTTIIVGQAWGFDVRARGGLAPYTYQWYEGNTPLLGQTSAQLTITKDTAGTYTYYCKVVDSEKTMATSNTATLTVNSLQRSSSPTPTQSSDPTTAPSPSLSISASPKVLVSGANTEASGAVAAAVTVVAVAEVLALELKRRRKN